MKKLLTSSFFIVFIILLVSGCKKKATSALTPTLVPHQSLKTYTSKMAGTRMWEGTEDDEGPGYNYSDTISKVFEIVVLNDSTIAFVNKSMPISYDNSDTLVFSGYDTTLKTMIFTYSYQDSKNQRNNTVTYNYYNNSIACNIWSRYIDELWSYSAKRIR